MISSITGYSLSRNGNDFITPHFQVKEFAQPGAPDVSVSADLVNKLELLSDCVNNKAIYIKKTYNHSNVLVQTKNYTAEELAILAQTCGFNYIDIYNKNILELSVDPDRVLTQEFVYACDWMYIKIVPFKSIDHIRVMETRESVKTTAAKFNEYEIGTNGTFFCTYKEPQFNFKINGLVLKEYFNHKWGMIFTKNRMRYGEFSQGDTFMSGHPILLDNGRFCEYNYASEIDGERARTAYGYDDDNLYILVCKPTKGLTLRGLRQTMSYIGCKYAINIDGGGSSALVECGEPIYTGDNRKVNNCIFIKLKEDI